MTRCLGVITLEAEMEEGPAGAGFEFLSCDIKRTSLSKYEMAVCNVNFPKLILSAIRTSLSTRLVLSYT